MEYNFQIFYEALWSASIIPFSTDATFSALAYFGNNDMRIPIILGIIGGTLGQIFNLLLGHFMMKLHHKGKLHVSEHWYNKCSGIFNKYLVWLIVFSWVSILKMILVFGGFLGTRLRFALPLIIIGQIIHYGSYLW